MYGLKPVPFKGRDTQDYFNKLLERLTAAAAEAGAGLMVLDGEFAAATPALLARADEYRAKLDEALNFTKPQFNESMRSGHANM